MKKICLGIITCIGLTLSAAGAEIWDSVAPYIEDHLEIGTRITMHYLTDAEQDYYGSINELEVDQEFAPLGLFVDYYFLPNIGIGWTRDDMTFSANTEGGGTDGDFELSQNTFSIIGRYPNESRYTPYGGIGLSLVTADFDATSSWSERGAGQSFDPDESTTVALHAGCAVAIQNGWSVDAYLRYLPVDIDVTYYLQRGREVRGPIEFEMNHVTLGVGARYAF